MYKVPGKSPEVQPPTGFYMATAEVEDISQVAKKRDS